MTTRLLTAAAAVALLGVAACSDRDDDVVQAPEGMTPTEQTTEPVAQDVAANVTALGMTRDELEDADLLSADRTDLGDVEAIIVDASGAVTGFAIDLEGSDRDVVIALDQDGHGAGWRQGPPDRPDGPAAGGPARVGSRHHA